MKNFKETSDTLIYKVTKKTAKEKLIVTIRLDENCKNGYEYFSMTAEGYENSKNGWIESFGGCCHDEILKYYPEFEIFKTVHLWSFGGYGTHIISNGYYFLNSGFNNCSIDNDNFANYFSDYFNCTLDQFKLLKDSGNEFEFTMLCIELGIVDQWKEIAKEAIAYLEELTGLKFKSKYDRDKNDILPNHIKLKEFKERKYNV